MHGISFYQLNLTCTWLRSQGLASLDCKLTSMVPPLQALPENRQKDVLLSLTIGSMTPILKALPAQTCYGALMMLGGQLSKAVLSTMDVDSARKLVRGMAQEDLVAMMQVATSCS